VGRIVNLSSPAYRQKFLFPIATIAFYFLHSVQPNHPKGSAEGANGFVRALRGTDNAIYNLSVTKDRFPLRLKVAQSLFEYCGIKTIPIFYDQFALNFLRNVFYKPYPFRIFH